MGGSMARRKAVVKNQSTSASGMMLGEKSMSMDLANYITTKQAAEMLGTDDSNIRHALIEGRIQGRKMGHYWLVYFPSLKVYYETKSPGGRPSSRIPKIQTAM
jgi:excisionase family DNA binding protein